MPVRRIQAGVLLAGCLLIAWLALTGRPAEEPPLRRPGARSVGSMRPSGKPARPPDPSQRDAGAPPARQAAPRVAGLTVRGVLVWSSDDRPVREANVYVRPWSSEVAYRRRLKELYPANQNEDLVEQAWRRYLARRSPRVRVDGAGQFTFGGLPAEELLLQAFIDVGPGPRGGTWRILWQQRFDPVQAARDGLRVVVPCAELRALVVDEQGSPVGGARVEIQRDGGPGQSYDRILSLEADHNGSFEVPHFPILLASEKLSIGVSKQPEYQTSSISPKLKRNDKVSLRFELRRAVRPPVIEGVVVDARGRPVQAHIYLRGAAPGEKTKPHLLPEDYHEFTLDRPELTDPRGRFRYAQYTHHGNAYDLVVAAPGHAGVIQRFVTPPRGRPNLPPLRVVLGAGDSTLRGTVVDAAGQPAEDACVWVSDPYDMYYPSTRTDKYGAYEIPVVPGRMYQVGACKYGRQHTEEYVTRVVLVKKMPRRGLNLGFKLFRRPDLDDRSKYMSAAELDKVAREVYRATRLEEPWNPRPPWWPVPGN